MAAGDVVDAVVGGGVSLGPVVVTEGPDVVGAVVVGVVAGVEGTAIETKTN